MENMFEDAYFGKQYRLRNGKMAVYIGKINYDYLIVEGKYISFPYNTDGTSHDNPYDEELEVVSEWKESINDEELEMLAFNNYCNYCHYCESANAKTLEEKYEACQKSECYRKTYVWKLITGYKAGYRKAKEV